MALPKWISAPFSQGTHVHTPAPSMADGVTTTRGTRAGVVFPERTPIESLRRMIDLGHGPAQGMSALTRAEAMRGLSLMAVRRPALLSRMVESPTGSTVCDLVAYARQRTSA